MAHDVFISYSTKNKAIADAVCARMESGGIRCWYAPRDIEPGADWAGSIIEAINASRIMILVFTPDSNVSKQVLREVDCAVSAGVTILPLRLTAEEPIESMRYYLSAVHWLDAVDADLNDALESLYELTRAVHETGASAALPTQQAARKKTPLWKPLTAGIACVAVLAALAVWGLPKLLGGKQTPSGDGNTSQKPAAADTALGENAPVGARSKQGKTDPDAYIETTTQSNILAGGYIAYDDGWYYFRSNDNEKLYKMREDGSEAQKLSDHSAMKIMVHDGYVYFEEEHGYIGIYRVSTDGRDEMQLYGSDVIFMGIIGDNLYFLDDYDGLRVIDLTQVNSHTWGGDTLYENENLAFEIYHACFDGNNLYYQTLHDDGLFRLSLDGSNPPGRIIDADLADPVLAGDYLYYYDLDEGTVKAYHLKTGETVTVVPFPMSDYHVCAEGIYGRVDDSLVRYDPSTGALYELSDRSVSYVCLVHNKIFFWDFHNFFTADRDGKNVIKL